MKVTKLVSIGFLLLTLMACNNQPKDSFILSGELVLPKNTTAKLMYLGIEKAVVIDSVLIDNEKSFSLGAPLKDPALFTLRIKGYKDIFLVIHPEDEITIEIDNSISPIAYTVTGSTDSRLVNEIMTQQQRVRDKITQLSIDYENSKSNPETFLKQKTKFDSIYDQILLDHKQLTGNFIKNNSSSLACIFALYQNFGKQTSQPLFDTFEDIEIFNLVDSALTINYSKTEAVIALNRDVTEIKEQIRHKKFTERVVTQGRKAPNFEIITIDNKTITLTDFNNEPVIYCFFAVWDTNSIMEAIELNRLIGKYGFRKLNVVGVSFDTSDEALRAFIKDNNIKFPIGCDYSYWDSKYVQQFGVREVPDILLLDKNHIVHKRNINSQELIQILNEWKKNNLF